MTEQDLSQMEKHEVKCSTCKTLAAIVFLPRTNVDIKIFKFHCNVCNYSVDDVGWIDSKWRRGKDQQDTMDFHMAQHNIGYKR